MNGIYEMMWQHSMPFLKNGQVETDHFIFSNNDIRRGLILILKPPTHILNDIQLFLKKARRIEPNQYYYPTDDIHLTVLSIISCFEELHLNQIKPHYYQKLIRGTREYRAPTGYYYEITPKEDGNYDLTSGVHMKTIEE